MDFEFTKIQKDIAKAAREFAEKEFTDRAEEFDRDETFDEALFHKAAELGFVGLFLEEKYSGAGLGIVEQCILQEEFAAVDLGVGTPITSASFGAEVIQKFGTEEQKLKYLPRIATGEAIMGSAFTEPDAGSDLAATSASAARDGDDLVINGGFGDVGLRALELVARCETVDAVLSLNFLGVPSTAETRRILADGVYEGFTPWEAALLDKAALLMEETGKPIINVPDHPVHASAPSVGARYAPVVLDSPRAAAQALGKMTWYGEYKRSRGGDQ